MPIDDWPPLEPDPVIKYYKQFVDVTLLRENLKLTPEQRIEKHQAALDLILQLRNARREPMDGSV